MESKQQRAVEEEEGCEPMSPTGQYFCSSALSLSILAILELEIPFDESLIMPLLENMFLSISPRFSSILVTDDNGVKQWKRVNVKLEDHIRFPIFPDGLSPESYDIRLQEYLSKLCMDRLPQSQPLWEIHFFRYPTTKAVQTLIFKLHHALGDGFSLMGALFSCFQRVDDPSLPLTFPSLRSETKSSQWNIYKSASHFLSMFLNTTSDFFSTLLKASTVLVDDTTPIRSGAEGVELRPITISNITFSLDQIKKIKAKIGGTLNDIIVSTIFFGCRLYMQSERKGSSNSCSTALVLLSTRQFNRYLTLKEMSKKDVYSPWGNQFAFIHVPLPKSDDPETEDPLKFISNARETINRKKNSLGVYLTGMFLDMITKFRGREATSQIICQSLKNTSMAITSMVGPIEQIALANHPCKGIYFMVTNNPQSLTIAMVSYMGMLRVTVGAEKGFVDHQLFTSCLEKAFERIFQAAVN